MYKINWSFIFRFLNFLNKILENKSCLFGLEKCSYTKKCIDELKKYKLDATIILCKKRGDNLPESVKKWKGDFIFLILIVAFNGRDFE